MEIIIHRVNKIKFLKSIPKNFGVEIDVRSFNSELILNHEPKKNGDKLSNFLKNYQNGTIIFNIKEAVENPQVESRNMIVKAFHKIVGDFKLAGNPIKMSSYKDEKTRGDIPDLDEHRQKIIEEFSN